MDMPHPGNCRLTKRASQGERKAHLVDWRQRDRLGLVIARDEDRTPAFDYDTYVARPLNPLI